MTSKSDRNQNRQSTRRAFLQKSIAAAGAATAPYYFASGAAWPAMRRKKSQSRTLYLVGGAL